MFDPRDYVMKQEIFFDDASKTQADSSLPRKEGGKWQEEEGKRSRRDVEKFVE